MRKFTEALRRGIRLTKPHLQRVAVIGALPSIAAAGMMIAGGQLGLSPPIAYLP